MLRKAKACGDDGGRNALARGERALARNKRSIVIEKTLFQTSTSEIQYKKSKRSFLILAAVVIRDHDVGSQSEVFQMERCTKGEVESFLKEGEGM